MSRRLFFFFFRVLEYIRRIENILVLAYYYHLYIAPARARARSSGRIRQQDRAGVRQRSSFCHGKSHTLFSFIDLDVCVSMYRSACLFSLCVSLLCRVSLLLIYIADRIIMDIPLIRIGGLYKQATLRLSRLASALAIQFINIEFNIAVIQMIISC